MKKYDGATVKVVCTRSVILMDYEGYELDVGHTAYSKAPLKIYEVPKTNFWTSEFSLSDYKKARYVQYVGDKKVGDSLTPVEFKEILDPSYQDHAEEILKNAASEKERLEREKAEYEAAEARKREEAAKKEAEEKAKAKKSEAKKNNN